MLSAAFLLAASPTTNVARFCIYIIVYSLHIYVWAHIEWLIPIYCFFVEMTINLTWSCLLCFDRGPKYHLLAHTTLSLSHIQDSFRTHDLTISGNGERQPPSICLLDIIHFPPPQWPSVCLFFYYPSVALADGSCSFPPCILIMPWTKHIVRTLLISPPPLFFLLFFLSVRSCSLTDSYRQGHCNKGCASEVTAV